MFDTGMTDLYLKQFPDHDIFVGLSPVLAETSKSYWENRNHVVFPSDFSLDLDYHCALGKEIIDRAESANQHVYLMPIKADVDSYLKGLFK